MLDIGLSKEEAFIQYLTAQFPSRHGMVGIGDDCAVILNGKNDAYLLTTDALVEGIHFLKEQISAIDLGYKTIAVNVSDIAAMGGSPKYALLSLALPAHIDSLWLKDLMKGIKEACEKWDIELLGGDTVGSKRDIFLNVALIGYAKASEIKYRHLAKSEDVICVNGDLGDSGGGLKILQGTKKRTGAQQKLLKAHFRPEPLVEEAIWLASHKEIHAMMDLSDGVNCDLNRLLRASHAKGEVEITQLPISEHLLSICLEKKWDPIELALTGGEDYCLLFTLNKRALPAMKKAYNQKFGRTFHEIGKVRRGRIKTNLTNPLVYLKDGKKIALRLKNFEHF